VVCRIRRRLRQIGAEGNEIGRLGGEQVAAGAGLQDVRADDLAQTPYIGMDRGRRVRGLGVVGPEAFDQLVDRDDPVRAQQQDGEKGTEPRRRRRDRTPVDHDVERTEDAELHPHSLAGMRIELGPVGEGDLAMFRRFAVEPGLIGLDWGGFRDPQAAVRRYAEGGFLGADGPRSSGLESTGMGTCTAGCGTTRDPSSATVR